MAGNLSIRRKIAAAILAGLCAYGSSAEAQNLPGFGFVQPYMSGYARDALRQQRMQERQQAQAERQAAMREHTPHVVSSLYNGQLGPVADLRRLVNGKTLYLERPVVADHVLQRMETEEVYLALNGQARGPTWAGFTWTIDQDALCMATTQQQRCLRALQDSAGQVFFVGQNNLLSHLVRVGNGDSANVIARYAQYQKQTAANNEMAAKLLGGLILGAMSSGGGGSGSNNTQYYYQNGSSGGSSGGGSGYTAPIGGERGLYGSSHGVGD